MGRKYHNYCTVLSEFKCTVTEDENTCDEKKAITYECAKGHPHTIKYTSFGNLVPGVRTKGKTFCNTCIIQERVADEVAQYGHKLVKYIDNTHLIYICGNCGSERTNNIRNMRKGSSGKCGACQHQSMKTSIDDVKATLAEVGLELVEYKNNKKVTVKCTCGTLMTKSMHDMITHGQRCAPCGAKKRAQTNTERYGASNTFAAPSIKSKIRETNLERHGVEYPMQNPDIKAKMNETNLERYGVKYTFTQPYVYEKIKRINMERYGVPYTMQNRAVLESSMMKAGRTKQYILPSGRQIHIMGYEDRAIEYLLGTYSEEDIQTGESVPPIKYMMNGTDHVYHADLYVKSANMIVEVKCPWTLEKEFDLNCIKFDATISAGYVCCVLVFDPNGSVHEEILNE